MVIDALNADQRAGASVDGKSSYTIEEAAAQLTRYGTSWAAGLGQGAKVTYAFRETAPVTMPDGTGGFTQLDSSQIAAAERAFAAWASVANITFVRVGSGTSGTGAYSNDATILLGGYRTGEDGAAAFAFLPGSRANDASEGDIWINTTLLQNSPGYIEGYGFATLVHEIGHAIGLAHPSEYDESAGVELSYAANASYFEDSLEYTVMSYFDPSSTGSNLETGATGPSGPLIDDIAAAQRLYGANTASHTGNDVYTSWPDWRSIWDAGGTDTLDLSGLGTNQKIDLHPGSFSNVSGLRGNISIALGTVIENAKGGSGDDQILGNDAANFLYGNAGNDLLSGFSGNDSYIGGVGGDRALLGGNTWDYRLVNSGGNALLLQAINGSGSAWIDPSTEIVQFQNGRYLAYGDVQAYVRPAQADGVTLLAAHATGETRIDGTVGPDQLFVDGKASDYTLSRGQWSSATGAVGDFVLTDRRDGANVIHVGEAIDSVQFRDGQYLSLRDLPAYIPGTSTLAIGGTQNDLLYRDASRHYEIFVGGAGNDILYLDGNAADYSLRAFTGTSEPDGGHRAGFTLAARGDSAELFIDSSVETVQFRNGQYLSFKDIPAYVAMAGAQAGDVHVVTGNQTGLGRVIAATGSTDTVYVEGNVGDYQVTRGAQGEFILEGKTTSTSLSQGIDVIKFGNGQYLSVVDLPSYMKSGSFTNGTKQDDMLWVSTTGDQYVVGGEGTDHLYLQGNVFDYKLKPASVIAIPYDPYAGASVPAGGYAPPPPLNGYELVALNGSGNVYIDISTDVIHFQNGQYLSFEHLSSYIFS